MKLADQYHKWVEWSEEDQTYLGKCPDLISGIHGDDPVRLYGELCEVVEGDPSQRRGPGIALSQDSPDAGSGLSFANRNRLRRPSA